jgi:hypothetical protein
MSSFSSKSCTWVPTSCQDATTHQALQMVAARRRGAVAAGAGLGGVGEVELALFGAGDDRPAAEQLFDGQAAGEVAAGCLRDRAPGAPRVTKEPSLAGGLGGGGELADWLLASLLALQHRVLRLAEAGAAADGQGVRALPGHGQGAVLGRAAPTGRWPGGWMLATGTFWIGCDVFGRGGAARRARSELLAQPDERQRQGS